MLTLAALGDPVTIMEIMRCAFETFKIQSDLKEACRDWDQLPAIPPPTWAMMKTHFSIEIQRNWTDLFTMDQRNQANLKVSTRNRKNYISNQKL